MKYLLSKIERKSLGNFILIILTVFSGSKAFSQATLPDCCSPSIKIGEVYWSGCNLHSSIVASTKVVGGVDFYDANKVASDPCPAGWRMPEVNDFLTISYGKTTNSSLGVRYDGGIFLNDTGYLNASDALQKANVGYYWIGGSNKVFNTATNGEETAIANGKYSIRCVMGNKIATAPTKPAAVVLPDFKGCLKGSSITIGQVVWAGCDLNLQTLAGGSLCGNGIVQYNWNNGKAGCEAQGWRLPSRYEFEAFSSMTAVADATNKNWTYTLPDNKKTILKYAAGGNCDLSNTTATVYWTSTSTSTLADYFSGESGLGFGNAGKSVNLMIRCVADIDNLPKDGNIPSSGNAMGEICSNPDVVVGNVVWAGCDVRQNLGQTYYSYFCEYNGTGTFDYGYRIDWQGTNACKNLNGGWRVPTWDEFKAVIDADTNPVNNTTDRSWSYKIGAQTLKFYNTSFDDQTCNKLDGTKYLAYPSSTGTGTEYEYHMLYSAAGGKPAQGTAIVRNNKYYSVRCVKDIDNTEIFLGCEYGSSVKISSIIWAGCDVTPQILAPNSTCTATAGNGGQTYYMYDKANSAKACANVGWRVPSDAELNAIVAITPTYNATDRTWDYVSVTDGRTLKLRNGGWNSTCTSTGTLLRYHGENNGLQSASIADAPILETPTPAASQYTARCVKTVN